MRSARDIRSSYQRPPSSFHSLFGVFVVIAMFIAAGIILYTAVVTGGFEDKREVREFGNMTCIYNKTDDTVESCERSPR